MKKELLTLSLCFITAITFSQNYKFEKVSAQELEEKVYVKDSTASAAYLYKYRSTYYDLRSGIDIVTDVVQRIKIYNKDGFDYATIKINYYDPSSGSGERITNIKAYTYNLVEGKIEKTKLSKKSIFNEELTKSRSQKKITMPNVKEGSVIEIKYRLTSPYYQSIDDLRFQYNIPIKTLDYKVSIPEYFVFNKRSKGYHYIPIKTSLKSASGGGYSYSVEFSEFKEKDIPALRDDEPYVSNIHNYRAGMTFELTGIKIPGQMDKYFSSTWKEVTKTIYNSSSFGSELKRTKYFKDDLKSVLVKATTPSQKIGAIFDFVKSKVKWNGYNGIGTNKGVRKAYKNGLGNVAEINLMMVAMLREAGLDANPVLISTRSNGFSFAPTIDGFNYVIATVNLQGKNILLDASEKFSTPNVLPLRAINWQGRMIKKDLSSDWISLTPNIYSSTDYFMSVALDENFDVSGVLRTSYKNLDAIKFRSGKNHLEDKDLITSLEDSYNIEVENYKVNNKETISKPVVRNVKFFAEDVVEQINEKIYISPLLFLTSKTNPFKLKERKFPVDYGVPFKNKTSVSIQIPEGYKVESFPESIAIGISDNTGVFGYKVVSNGKKVNIISQLQINKALITPEYYEELQEFYNQMVKKQTEKIVLIKE